MQRSSRGMGLQARRARMALNATRRAAHPTRMTDSLSGPADATTEGGSDRAELIAQRAFGLAHDLNNVFMPITGYATLIREALTAGSEASLDVEQMLLDLDVILRASQRGTELTNDLMQLANSPDHVP